jgi:hypothetical protein
MNKKKKVIQNQIKTKIKATTTTKKNNNKNKK